MTIELRNIRLFPGMSEETTAFKAKCFLDGALVGEARNDGRGGGSYVPVPFGMGDRLVDAAIEHPAFVEVAEDYDAKAARQWALEIVLYTLVQAEEERRWLKRHCRKKTVLRLPDSPAGQFEILRTPFSPQVKEWVERNHPDAQIMNETVE